MPFGDPTLPRELTPTPAQCLTPEELAVGNDFCMINVPAPVLLNIGMNSGTNIYVYFPAGVQTWSMGCPAWRYMVQNGCTPVLVDGNPVATFQNIGSGWTLGPILQPHLLCPFPTINPGRLPTYSEQPIPTPGW
jgi:hypothetical protein